MQISCSRHVIVGMTTNGKTFIPIFVKICHLLQNFLGDVCLSFRV